MLEATGYKKTNGRELRQWCQSLVWLRQQSSRQDHRVNTSSHCTSHLAQLVSNFGVYVILQEERRKEGRKDNATAKVVISIVPVQQIANLEECDTFVAGRMSEGKSIPTSNSHAV